MKIDKHCLKCMNDSKIVKRSVHQILVDMDKINYQPYQRVMFLHRKLRISWQGFKI